MDGRRRDRYVINPLGALRHLRLPPTASGKRGGVAEGNIARAFGFEKQNLFRDICGQENAFERQIQAEKKRYLDSRLSEISNSPVAILDCPDLRDDFYLNVLDWSLRNIVSIALDCSVYSYNYDLRSSECFTTSTDGRYVCALRSLRSGDLLAVSNCGGCVSIFDVETGKETAKGFVPDDSRVASLVSKDNCSMFNDHVFLAGSKFGRIYGYDLRQRLCTSILCLEEHSLEVCGLEMAHDSWMFASGGNDNKVCIWDLRRDTPLFVQDDYESAVKAMAWCPWQSNLFATGAGTGDRRLRIWNTSTNTCMRYAETDSQICGLMWSPLMSEVITTHGYLNNELIMWTYPYLDKIFTVQAHEARALHAALSPDGTIVATAAANESLKFWELYKKRPPLRSPAKRHGMPFYERDSLAR